jgi:hypothetical protein
MTKITNSDLWTNQYPTSILEENLDHLSIKQIIITQKNITKEFAKNFLLDEKYHKCDEDSFLTMQYIRDRTKNFNRDN